MKSLMKGMKYTTSQMVRPKLEMVNGTMRRTTANAGLEVLNNLVQSSPKLPRSGSPTSHKHSSRGGCSSCGGRRK